MARAGEKGATEEELQLISLRAMELRMAGYSYSKLAKKLVDEGIVSSCSDTMAHHYVNWQIRRRNRELDEAANEVRRLELERLDHLLNKLWDRAESGSLDHIEMYLKIAARRSKFLGLDAPVRTETTVKDETRSMQDAEVYARMRRLHARLEELGFPRHPMLDEANPFEAPVEGEVVKEPVVEQPQTEKPAQPGS